ncbi:MAG TPA: SMP-30/gluconolactonase/LRE family protein [Kofleriaceae bacterium]|jgi:gluconolactonase|nr:SMP-30/gluconolactonase/LRE family protein [Kofleriaceae bacterium]
MKLEPLAWGYGLIEGPRCDGAGNLYFSDVTNGGVFRMRPDGSIDVIVPKRRGVGGIALHADGGVVISGKNICHVRAGATRVLFANSAPGFNDLFADAEGRVYTGSLRSDPFSASGARTPGECYRIEAEGRATQLYGDVLLSNGIGFSPDGRTMYHSDSAARSIRVHRFDAEGRVTPAAGIAVEGFPDGLAVDSDGGVWVALYGSGAVQRYLPSGQADTRIAVPARAVTSLCFGGLDLRDMYVVTADNTDDPARAGTIFRTRCDVAGLPAPLARI